jgi:hypothetical protein
VGVEDERGDDKDADCYSEPENVTWGHGYLRGSGICVGLVFEEYVYACVEADDEHERLEQLIEGLRPAFNSEVELAFDGGWTVHRQPPGIAEAPH